MTAYVLFVDDDIANLIVWEAACVERFPILTAGNADEALAAMREHEVAVILTDLRMPGRSGIQLLEQVRAEFPTAIRMLITAHSEVNAAVEAINRGGVRRFLEKPCSIEDLRAEIGEAMDLYALRLQARALERRLMLTERIYTLGLVAAGRGLDLGRPAEIIRESMHRARTEVQDIVTHVDPGVGQASQLRRHLDALEAGLTTALLDVERVMELSIDQDLQSSLGADGAVDVVAVLQLALSIARGELSRDAELSLELSDVPMARGTTRKLSQVILSLLVNASEAVSMLPPAQRAITVRLNTERDHVFLDVLDNGPTLASTDLGHLFDPLHVSSSARKGGLGLAISKALVEEMGGELRVENRDTVGASFRVVLRAA